MNKIIDIEISQNSTPDAESCCNSAWCLLLQRLRAALAYRHERQTHVCSLSNYRPNTDSSFSFWTNSGRISWRKYRIRKMPTQFIRRPVTDDQPRQSRDLIYLSAATCVAKSTSGQMIQRIVLQVVLLE